MTAPSALIGHTGFVGSALLRQRRFDACFNSKTINLLAGQSFDEIVCAGAPATMWAANNDAEGDAASIGRLVEALSRARIGRLVLISTIAVFDDSSAGYTERSARFETVKAYGRHRRALEEAVSGLAETVLILRLPALFGDGLKKNFVFDLLNPTPSFLKPAAYQRVVQAAAADARHCIEAVFAFDAALGMWRLDRETASPHLPMLDQTVRDVGLEAARFTNSKSCFQFYDMSRLASDIAFCLANHIDVINFCSSPLRAADLHESLTGLSFDNTSPPCISEDVQSIHADLFGDASPYLFGADETFQRLRAFFERKRP